MSPTDTRRFTNSAPTTHPAEPFIPAPPNDEQVWAQGDDGNGPPATDPRPSRSLTSGGVRNFRPRPFDDPATTRLGRVPATSDGYQGPGKPLQGCPFLSCEVI